MPSFDNTSAIVSTYNYSIRATNPLESCAGSYYSQLPVQSSVRDCCSLSFVKAYFIAPLIIIISLLPHSSMIPYACLRPFAF